MEINKIKVLIYVLTFAGYAWTGYGSSVLTNLKDAVLMAEKVFGDIIVKAVDVLSKIKSVHDTLDLSVEEECKWSCPNGGKAVQNRYYKPVPNGCGPVEMVLDSRLPFAEMTKCCDQHDLCYGACNNDKDQCDLDFKKCLYRICEAIPQEEFMTSKGCKASAKLLYTGTTALGCKFYLDSQKEACYCKEKRKSRNDEL